MNKAQQAEESLEGIENLICRAVACDISNQQEEALHELESTLRAQVYNDITRFTTAQRLLLSCIPFEETITDRLFSCLLACGSLCAISAVLDVFRKIVEPGESSDAYRHLDISMEFLKKMIFQRPFGDESLWASNLLGGDDTVSTFTVQETIVQLADLVLLLPKNIANVCYKLDAILPSWTVQHEYLPAIIENAMTMALLSNDENSKLYFCLLCKRVLRSRGGEFAALGLYRCFESRQESSELKDLESMIHELHSNHLSPRESATLIRASIRYELSKLKQLNLLSRWDELWLTISCRPILAHSSMVRDAVIQLMILNSSGNQRVAVEADRATCHLVASLFSELVISESDQFMEENGDSESTPAEDVPLRQALEVVAEVWSQESVFRHGNVQLDRSMSLFLLSGMNLLTKKEECVTGKMVEHILQGVTFRLHSKNSTVRVECMKVGEILAERLGQKLKFNELDEYREAYDNLAFTERVQHEDVTRGHFPPKQDQEIDPDAEYASEPDGDEDKHDDDSVWSEDDILEQYNIEDDEDDLRTTPRPLYLRDCLDLLRTAESDSNAWSCHQTALQELPNLVRSRPADLQDVAGTLAFQVLRLENKFDIESFSEFVGSALRALVVEEPVLVGQTLIAEMFQDSGLLDRLKVLTALNEGTLELSGHGQLLSQQKPRISRQIERSKLSGKHHLVEDDNNDAGAVPSEMDLTTSKDKTRRWGKPSKEAAIISNKFVSVAPIWFYMLVGMFMERKSDPVLWKGDLGATLLSQIFVSLSVMVECSGPSSGSSLLAKDLFELVWSFRMAEVAEVRSSVLCAVAALLPYLPQEDIVRLVMTDGQENLLHNLKRIEHEDPDEVCRGWARTITWSVPSVFKSLEG